MQHRIWALLALAALVLGGCAGDDAATGGEAGRANSALGVSPITPYQIEGGKGWR